MASARNHYLVPDSLALGLDLVFCGTAPSAASAKASAYYAKPGNGFWPTLHRLGFTPRLFAPREYPSLLPLGIGLTDLCKCVSGNDDELPRDAIDTASLRRKVSTFQPRMIAFTSKHGAQLFLGGRVEYGLQAQSIGRTRVFVLCSTSGRARRFWREDVWRDLAALHHSNPRSAACRAM
jgi:TDG/mug DNA glycosylase family protein